MDQPCRLALAARMFRTLPRQHVALDLLIDAFIKEQLDYHIVILFLYFNMTGFFYNPMYFMTYI